MNPDSGYAAIDDLGKIPLDSTEGINNYKLFLDSGFSKGIGVIRDAGRPWPSMKVPEYV